MDSKYVCCKCKHKETDEIGDMFCTNPKSSLYFCCIEEEKESLDSCQFFENNKE